MVFLLNKKSSSFSKRSCCVTFFLSCISFLHFSPALERMSVMSFLSFSSSGLIISKAFLCSGFISFMANKVPSARAERVLPGRTFVKAYFSGTFPSVKKSFSRFFLFFVASAVIFLPGSALSSKFFLYGSRVAFSIMTS